MALILGSDSNLNVGALFETHIIAVFVGKRIFDAEISIRAERPGYRDLRLSW
jgi:hypothetical protein